MNTLVSSNVWEDDYKSVLKGLPKNSWVPWINGKIGNKSVEISCVHTSDPHGLISWGWDGTTKIVLLDTDEQDNSYKKEFRVKLQKSILNVAKELCVFLNKEFPNGVK